MPGKCLVCALLAKKRLAVCLALYLAFDARRCGRGGSGCEICGRSGGGRYTCRAVSAGGFPITRTCSVYRSGCWCVGGLIVVVLVILSLPDLWLISPAEYGCSGQCGRRSGCVVLPNRFRRAVSGSIMQKKKPVRLDSRAGFRAVWGPDRVGLRVLHSFQRGRLGV